MGIRKILKRLRHLLILVLAIVAILCVGCGGGEMVDLDASLQYGEGQFVIANRDAFDWSNVEFEVNDEYKHTVGRLAAGATYRVRAVEFTKKDGARFNPLTMKPLRFFVWCDTPDGDGSWYGEWK